MTDPKIVSPPTFGVGDTIRITNIRHRVPREEYVWEGVVTEGDEKIFCLKGKEIRSGREEHGWFGGDAQTLWDMYQCEQVIEVIARRKKR